MVNNMEGRSKKEIKELKDLSKKIHKSEIVLKEVYI